MKKIIISISVLAVILVAIICLFSSVYTVAENEYACIARFSKIIDVKSEPGINFKVPFIDNVRVFPKTTLLYDIPESDVLTSDKKSMTVDSYILWKIDDPLLFFQSLGTTAAAESRLNDITFNSFKTKMGVLQQSDIINDDSGAQRNLIYEDIKSDVQGKTSGYGISVVDVKLKRLDLPEANEQAVYQRMISERTKEAEEYTAGGEKEASIIKSNVDKEVNIMISDAKASAENLRAEGESEYMKIIAQSCNTPDKVSFYEYQLALDALKNSITGDNKTLILGKDSKIAKFLLNNEQ